MLKLRKISGDGIKKRISDGLITVSKHPFLDLYIYNYTKKAQYNKLWDEYTIRCRGLIVDNDGNMLNNPYLERYKGTEYEGFVCKYSNGLRVKIKSSDYRRLSKILTGISARDIWSSLKDTETVDQILDNVPDEFFDWVKKIETELKVSKIKIMRDALDITLEAKKLENRTKRAEYIINRTENTKSLRGIAFFLLDNRTDKAEKAVWKLIEPSGEILWKAS